MTTPLLLKTYASYVPALMARRLATSPSPPTVPIAEGFPAAVLLADITGFTAIAERLAQCGPAGAEELSQLLNAYFGRLIDLITVHGGDVIKFAGDALLALWPARDEDLSTVTRRAVQCGLTMQATLHNYETAEGICLSLHVGIGSGEVLAIDLGGVDGRWEFLVTGSPLVQVSTAERQAQPGEVVLSLQAWTLVQEHCTGHPLPMGQVRLESVHTPLSINPVAPPALTREMETALRAYIPNAILARLSAGQSGWLAELRRLTVLFVNLPDLNYATPLDKVQTVMRSMQTILYHYEGTINKLSVDDQGATLVAAFGLPPLAHKDDVTRGVQSALVMRDKLREMGWRSAIGITSGSTFCGEVGNTTRCEYTMIGDVVNLASRLMQAASDDLLCDETTYQVAQAQVAFDTLPAIVVKGRAGRAAIYRPLGQKKIGLRAKTAVVGRVAERTILAERIQALLRGMGGVIIIEGEAGIGKSRLVEDLLLQGGATSLLGAGDAVERSTPYFAWRPVFARLFNLDLLNETPERQRAHVLAQLEAARPDLVRLAPLLNAVLPLDLPENELTSQMTGEVRADNTNELLVDLLKQAAKTAPLLLIMEDAHWLDSASWALTRLVNRDVQPLLLVIATRPMSEPLPAGYTHIRDASDAQHLLLDALPPAEIDILACQCLGVDSLPASVVDLIREKAEGHPFFSEELAYALRDAGLILIANGQCQIAPGVGDLRLLDFPDTIQGVITGRIDRLTPQQQLTLKVASVIGHLFAFRVLRDVYPIEADKPRLADYLSTLERLDITLLQMPEPDLAYVFKHVITQEVTYNLMTFAQRRRLHRAVAEWYERTHTDDLAPFYPLLAHHWMQAVEGQGAGRGLQAEPELVSKATDYLEKAGEQALHGNANQEAIGFFSTLLGWDKDRDMADVPPLRRAHWERQLGKAYYGLGKLRESRDHLERALALLGQPVPATRVRLAASLLGQVLRQVLHRLRPVNIVEYSPKARATMLETARAYTSLGDIYYLDNESVLTIYTCLRTLNLAERTEPSPMLARAYADMCLAAGLSSLHSLAEMYSRRAREVAQSVNDLPTLARVLETTGLYALGIGQWAKAQDSLERAASMNKHLGNRREWDECTGLLSWTHYFQGDFTHSTKLWVDVTTSARRGEDPQSQIWGLCGQVESGLLLGLHPDQAVAILEEAKILLSGDVDRPEQIRVYSLLGKVCQRRNELQLAQQAAEMAAHWIAQTSPTAIYSFEGYAGAAETCLLLWEASGDQPAAERQALAQSTWQACRSLHGFAGVFPIAQPRAWLWQGLYEWLAGKPGGANKAWQKSLAYAERLKMPYEQGLAHYEIGRHLAPNASAQRVYLERAAKIFTQLEAAYDLGRVQQQLERATAS